MGSASLSALCWGAMVLIATSQLASILFCFTFLAFLLFCFCLCFLLFGFEHVPLNSSEHFFCNSVHWLLEFPSLSCVEGQLLPIREIKLDVTWSSVKRQTAKMTSEFVFFSYNPSLNHIKIAKCLLLFATNTNIFTLLFKELNTDAKSFIFCRFT